MTPETGRSPAARRGNLVENIRQRLLQEIIEGGLKPGTILQLSNLAHQYGVSRTPVREALIWLERDGLVQAVASKGYQVPTIEPRDVVDVFFMRRLLEGTGARLAAPVISEEALTALRGASAPTSCVMTLRQDDLFHDFHRTIVTAAGSPRLATAFELVYTDLRRLQYAGLGDPRPDLIHAEHVVVLERLGERDATAAQAAMEAHIDAMRARAVQSWLSGDQP